MKNNIKLEEKEDGIYITAPDFVFPNKNLYINFTPTEVELCAQYSISMNENRKKPRYKHEPDKKIRNDKEYIMDMFLGKLGEVFTYNSLINLKIACSEVDFKIYDGYDDSDFKIFGEFLISVKTSKSISRFGLLENNKYDLDGKYLHSMSGGVSNPLEITAFIFPVIKLDEFKINSNIKPEDFKEYILKLNPKAYMYGFVGKLNLVKKKVNNDFYPSGYKLNQYVPLEVDNIVFRLDDCYALDKLKEKIEQKILKEKNEKTEIR